MGSFGAEVTVENFHRLLYNMKLFQVGKLANPVTLRFTDDRLEASVDDGHVYVTDWCPSHHSSNGDYWLSPLAVKRFELSLRSVQDTWLSLVYNGHWMQILTSRSTIEQSTEAGTGDMDDRRDLIDPAQWLVYDDPGYEVKPGTFRKLDLLKPGDYPASYAPKTHLKYGPVLMFKSGPTVKGSVALLDRDILHEKVDSDQWMW